MTDVYFVDLQAIAIVSATVEVAADSHEEAKVKALERANAGDVVWSYSELMEEDNARPEVSSVSKLTEPVKWWI